MSDLDADGVADPDPNCTTFSRNCEKDRCGCGLGVELLLLLPVLLLTRALRRRGAPSTT